jgi:hypothetical protein
MTNEAQALVPGSTSLPAAIERRTQITNRLLGELTRRLWQVSCTQSDSSE